MATKLGEFFITSSILALATSLPELFVCLAAAAEGSPNLALGNILGSNIANLSLIIGGAALMGGELIIRGKFLSRDAFYAFLAGAAPMLLLFDQGLSRLDGLILLALYGFYNLTVLNQSHEEVVAGRGEGKRRTIHKLVRRLSYAIDGRKVRELALVFLGVALLLFSAEMLVKAATGLARGWNLPDLIIGLFLVSVGTSLPELVFETKAARNRKPRMVFGDLLGSIVANGTLICGLTALMSPFKIKAFADYLLATLVYVLIFGLFYFFIRTKHRLERWEGFLLMVVFLLFGLVKFAGIVF